MGNKFCYELPGGLNNWGQVTNMPESLRKIGEKIFDKGKDPLSTWSQRPACHMERE